MIDQKTINYFEDNTPNYFIVIGVDGYNSIAENYRYFDDYYLPKYIEKITLISMLLMSWYSVEIAIGFCNMTEKTKKYVEAQVNKQGLSLWLDESND